MTRRNPNKLLINLAALIVTTNLFAAIECPPNSAGAGLGVFNTGSQTAATLGDACFGAIHDFFPNYNMQHNDAKISCESAGDTFVSDFPGVIFPGVPNGTGGSACQCQYDETTGDWTCNVSQTSEWICCTEGNQPPPPPPPFK